MSDRRPRSVRLPVTCAVVIALAAAGYGGYQWWQARWLSSSIRLLRVRRAAVKTPPPSAEDRRAISDPINVADVKQTDSGFGLVVCDPHVPSSAAKVSALAMGCSVWLQFHAGGQAELGKTPRHLSIRRAQAEMEKDLLDLTPQETIRFGRITGATHVALGAVEGNPQRSRLTYQLHSTADGKPFGAPYVLSGSEAEITRDLPNAARALTTALGVRKPALPAQIKETPADLRWFGQCPWPIGRVLAPAERTALEAMRTRSSLALLFLALSNHEGLEREKPQNFLYQVSADLASREPNNTIAVSEAVITLDEKHLQPAFANADQRIRTLLRANPHNYLLHSGLSYSALNREGQRPQSRDEAFLALCAATGNPDAWYALAGVLEYEGLEIRKGRYVGDMTAAELSADSQIKNRATAFWKRVVEIDSTHVYGWPAVATAAAYQGDSAGMENALQKACSIPASRFDGYVRAFQLYGPNFHGDNTVRRRYAKRMVGEKWTNSWERVAVARALHEAGFSDLAGQALRSAEERRMYRHWHLGAIISASTNIVPAKTPTEGAADGLPVPSSAPYQDVLRHSGDVTGLAWSPDGARLASAGWDNTVRVSAPGQGELALLHGHTMIVRDVDWHPGGNLLASGGDDATVRIWDTRAGRELRSFKSANGLVSQVAWSPDGKTLAVVGRTSTAFLNAETGVRQAEIGGPGGPATCLQYSHDGKTLFMNRWEHWQQPERMLQLWSLADKKPTYFGRPAGSSHGVAWSRDGKRVAAGTREGHLQVWDTSTGNEVRNLKPPDGVLAVSWHAGGRYLATAGDDRRITLWDMNTGKMVHMLRGSFQPISRLAWSSKGRWLASSSAEGRVVLWDLTKALPAAAQ